ncbi:MAG: PDZ domain-containing protein [Planctomycetes bacterium]|nr:PDZ domain-containing protein [Planctomycetota bacterium]
MKRWTALGLALLLAWPAVAPADTATLLSDLVTKTSGSLAVLRYTVALETGNRTAMGQAICVDNPQQMGIFLTTALDPRMSAEMLKDFQLVLPGVEGKTIKAKFLGVDPWTGLGFVQATEKHDWQVVQFARTSGLKLGDQVASIGLMMGEPSHPVYVGTAYVSAKLRVPGELIYVTGGRLTSTCSPVFAADGRAIGIVGRQLFLGYQMPSRRGMVTMRLRNQQESAFFTPVEEFAHVLEKGKMPTGGKVARLPWMGINKFEAVGQELAAILNLKEPAVKIDQVIPNQPAAKAGLSNRDIIIAFNGQPLEKLATPDLTVRNFVRTLMRMSPGDTIKLKVISGRQTKDVSVTLAEMPTRPSEAKRYFNKALGLLVREKVMLDEYLDKSEAAKVPGLIVLGIVKASPAATAGLRGGDVITNVNNQPINTVSTFSQIVEKSLASSRSAPINFLVRRGNEAQVITVKPGG